MRVLIKSYGDVRIFYDKIFCYKRYHVLWKGEDRLETYSGLWYNEEQVIKLVEDRVLWDMMI